MILRTLLALAAAVVLGSPVASPDRIVIRGAHVFDGTGSLARIADVSVRAGRIVAVAPRLPTRGARVIEAAGMTLLPGLHDLHTHARVPGFPAPEDLGQSWAAYLAHGVTAITDFSVAGAQVAPIRRLLASGAVPAPRLHLAVRIGVPGGHGTEGGWGRDFTLTATTPAEGRAAVARARRSHPDLLKVFADGWRYGRAPDLADMDAATLRTIVRAAHRVGLPVVTHTVTLAGAKRAAAAGVDALGHGVGDAPVDAALIRLMRANGTAYVPTLVVFEPQSTRTLSAPEWRTLRPGERTREGARTPPPPPPYEAKRWAIMQDNVRRLHAAGVPIAVGTDAGVGGVYHGSATLREIALLADLGLSPRQALAAATARAARVLRTRHGRIAPGRPADLVLVRGRPDLRLADLHAVAHVLVAGREVPLPALRARLAGDQPTPMPRVPLTGPIPLAPVDGSEGGPRPSRVTITRRGSWVTADVRFGAHAPFGSMTLPLTAGGILPADARAFAGIAFTARGDGAYRLAIAPHARAGRFAVTFHASPQGGEVRLPFTAFADPEHPLDRSRLRALVFRIEGEPGARRSLAVSRLRFYRSGAAR